MTREQIIAAGAKAIANAFTQHPAPALYIRVADRPAIRVACRAAAAAMLDAITEGMGNKLMGRPSLYDVSDRSLRFWDAAPWRPGGEK